MYGCVFFFKAEDGIRDLVRSRGLGEVYKRQVEGYRYGVRDVSRSSELAEIRAGLPSLRATVVLAYPDPPTTHDVFGWDDFMSETAPLEFEQVPAEHPLYVLYSLSLIHI